MIGRILKDLGRINGVNGSLVVGKDGLIIETEVPSDIDAELVAAMSSAVFGTAERSAEDPAACTTLYLSSAAVCGPQEALLCRM